MSNLINLRNKLIRKVQSLVIFDLIVIQHLGKESKNNLYWSTDPINTILGNLENEFFKNNYNKYIESLVPSKLKDKYIIPVLIPKISSFSIPGASQKMESLFDMSKILDLGLVRGIIIGEKIADMIKRLETAAKEKEQSQGDFRPEKVVENINKQTSTVFEDVFGTLTDFGIKNMAGFSETVSEASVLEKVWALKSPRIFTEGWWTNYDINISFYNLYILGTIPKDNLNSFPDFLYIGSHLSRELYFDLLRMTFYVYYYSIIMEMARNMKFPVRTSILLFLKTKTKNETQFSSDGTKFLQKYASVIKGLCENFGFATSYGKSSFATYIPSEFQVKIKSVVLSYYVFDWEWKNSSFFEGIVK